MSKDLTNSSTHRQNILNNQFALQEIEDQLDLKGIIFEEKLYLTKRQVANYFEVDIRTIERYLSVHEEELKQNGYENLIHNRLKTFKLAYVTDINVGDIEEDITRAPSLGVFTFRAFLNLGMLLTDSQPAKELRSFLLDIVIDTLNQRLGGSTKLINQEDNAFLESAIREYNYRKEFTNALDKYIVPGKLKYGIFTNLVYVSIFREKAREYRQILKLHEKDKVRNTMYSEVLDLVASYENGFADFLKNAFQRKGEKFPIIAAKNIFKDFERQTSAVYKPLIEKARGLMASRDLAFRDALHLKLQEYIMPVTEDEFEKFLGEKSQSLQERIDENIEVFKRLKDR